MADDGWNSDDNVYVSAPTSNIRKNEGSRHRQTSDNRGSRFIRTDRRKLHTKDAEKIEVKSDMVGRLIGRGGSKIRELETSSQAKIKVHSTQNYSDYTLVTVDGTDEAKLRARSLIERLVEVKPPVCTFVNFADPERYAPENNQDDNHSEPEEEPIDWVSSYNESVRQQEAHWASLPPILKNFYQEDPDVTKMSEKKVAKWREMNYGITVKRICDNPDDPLLPKIPNPVMNFAQAFAAYPDILEEIRKQGFVTPSPIQSQSWPILLSGNDMIGIAQTGTGKTLAFLLPALIHIDKQPTPLEERDGPNVLVLAPTRELALQIEKEVNKYHFKGYKAVCIYGGASRTDQIEEVSRGVQIVIATPGRLNDLVKAGHINVEAVTYLVLDEADRMLDMGFGPQIRISLQGIRPTRQTVMTSATWPNDVQRLGLSYMVNPIQVVVGSLDLTAVHTVAQEIVFVNDDMDEKFAILVDFLRSMESDEKVIVFCGRRNTAIQISADIALLGILFQSIYGGLDQGDREQALEDLRSGAVNILIATDIASRGLDIDNVTHIINFDFPHNMEEYVHRVGRTGRAGRTGTAITYFSRNDWSKAEGLINILKEAEQEVPAQLLSMAERYKNKKKSVQAGRSRGGGRGGRGGAGFWWD